MSEHPMIGNILSLARPGLWQHSIDLAQAGLHAWLPGRRPGFARVVFVGHGTSLYNGQAGKFMLEHIAGIPAEAIPAFSFAAYAETSLLGPQTLVVGISTTGTTQSTVDALARARAAGSPTVAITAHGGTPVTRAADAVLLSGGEGDAISVKTSSYVLALVSVTMLALALSGMGSDERESWQARVREAGAGAGRFLAQQRGQVQELAQTFAQAANVFMLGSGPNIGTAGEGALKIIEMAKLYSESQELEDFFHGRLREVDQVNPLFFVAPGGRASARVLDFLTVTHHVQAPAVVLTDAVTPGIEQLAAHVIRMPVALDEVLTPLLYIIPLHLFGYELALARGHDPNSGRYGIVAQNVRFGDKLSS